MAFLTTTFPVGVLSCNCTIIADDESKSAIIVDPGGDAGEILKWCGSRGLAISLLVHTHGHFDHILAAAELRQATGAPIALHENDRWLYENVDVQGRMFGMQLKSLGTFDFTLDHEQVHQCGAVALKTIFTPGHTPGSVCFHVEKEKLLLSGDTLFAGGIGRTDLWGGNHDAIMKSIDERLLCLDESTVIVPGHGSKTTLQHELENNPFLMDLA